MKTESKAPFTFDDAIARRIEITPGQKLADDEFHKSRIMSAFVDRDSDAPEGKLIYALDDERDHANQLHDILGMDAAGFEDIIRGYIRPLDDRPGTEKCVVYKGMSHEPIEVSDYHRACIIALWDQYFHEDKELQIWTGCKIGEVGTVWPAIMHLLTVNRDLIENFEDKCYERYVTKWIPDHGHTVYELIRELQEMFADSCDNSAMDPETAITELMDDCETDRGFGGEIYACKDEFLENEYTMHDAMQGILSEREYATYMSYQPWYMAEGMTTTQLQ